jgi:cell shape-determining protein MreC
MLTAAVVALLILSLAPTRVTGWVTAFQGPLQTIVGPVSGTLVTAAGWLRPAVRTPREAPEQAELVRQRDEALRRLQQANQRIEELRERLGVIEQVRGAVAAPAEPLVADVVGRELGAATITVRAGRLAGVRTGLVVVDDRSLQLIGRVVSVGPTTSVVRLVTAEKGAGSRWVRGVVFDPNRELLTADEQAALPIIDLRPTGDGGFLSAETENADVLRAGSVVKVDDPDWPREAQLLELGVVGDVLDIDHPMMVRVAVRPRIDDLGMVARVVILLPAPDRDDRPPLDPARTGSPSPTGDRGEGGA